MPRKQLFTKDEIVSAALELTRKGGIGRVTARSLAQALGTSAKPIFGLFENMEDVQREVIAAANALYQRRLKQEMESGVYPPYKASGMAYIRFAKEEKELFRLLFMRDRSNEVVSEDRREIASLLELIAHSLHIDEQQAYRFHLEMWLYVHGIATMIATAYLDWDMEFASRALTDVYGGLCCRYTAAGKKGECAE